MPRFTEQDRRILRALEMYDSAGDVAAATGAPLRRVIHLQRLFGRPDFQVQRALEDAESYREMRQRTVEALQEPCKPHRGERPATAPSPERVPYWERLTGSQRPHRTARMVPDDRSEELTFDGLMERVVAGIQAEGRRGEGRGAA